jgi:hypothetical protein
MNRRTVLSLAAVTAGSQTLPRIATAQGAAFESGGLGLPISDWEDQFGKGEAGQTYMSFALKDGNFWVGVGQGVDTVDYIERNYTDESGVTLADAQEEAAALLPADARFQESYVANYAQILHGTQIDRYQSRSLPDQLTGADTQTYTRNFVVTYELSPAQAAFDYVVTRYFIIAGTKVSQG